MKEKERKPVLVSIKNHGRRFSEKFKAESALLLVREDDDEIISVFTGRCPVDDAVAYLNALENEKERLLKTISENLGITIEEFLKSQEKEKTK